MKFIIELAIEAAGFVVACIAAVVALAWYALLLTLPIMLFVFLFSAIF